MSIDDIEYKFSIEPRTTEALFLVALGYGVAMNEEDPEEKADSLLRVKKMATTLKTQFDDDDMDYTPVFMTYESRKILTERQRLLDNLMEVINNE